MSVAYSLARRGMTAVYNTFVTTPPVLDTKVYFPQAGEFQRSWRQLRDEALQISGSLDEVPKFHELMPEQYRLSDYGDREWRILIVRAYGLDIEENMARCPTLAALLRNNSAVLSASLSFLAPGKIIPTHTGPFRGITRYYLGIEIPTATSGEPGVVLTVDGTAYKLGNGEALLWDDTYPHSVVNHTDRWRIALLLDIYRQQMPLPLQWFTNSILAVARQTIKSRKMFPREFV